MGNSRFMLIFTPDLVNEPITYRMVKDFDLMINILRAEIDDIISGFDDVKVMFNDDDGVPGINKAIDNIEKFLDIAEMKPRRGFIKDVERIASRFFPEFP